MEKWVTLIEALKNPEKYNDISSQRIAYEPEHRSVTFGAELLGYGETQTFETEHGLTYYPALYQDPILHQEGVYLVASDVTTKKLALYGKNGYKNGIEAIIAVQMLYGNSELEAEGRNWHQSTIGIIDLLPTFLKESFGIFWMASSYCYAPTKDTVIFGMHYADPKTTKFFHGHFQLYRKGNNSGYGYPSNCAIKPLIQLPKNTLIQLGGISNAPLEIRRFDPNLI